MLNNQETFEQVVERIQRLIVSTEASNTDQYWSLLEETVKQITLHSLQKDQMGSHSETSEDLPRVVDGLDLIVQDIALLYGMKYRDVEQDMLKVFTQFPTEDFKLAYYLSQHNKLH